MPDIIIAAEANPSSRKPSLKAASPTENLISDISSPNFNFSLCPPTLIAQRISALVNAITEESREVIHFNGELGSSCSDRS